MRAWMPEKRRHIFEWIKRRGTISITALVDEMGLSKNATRAHLLTLEEQGLIERVKPEVESRGRPPLVYRISAAGQDLFPRSDDEVLTGLIQFLEREDGGQALLHRFFAHLWALRQREYEEELSSLEAPEQLSARLAAMRMVLERGGFLPALAIDGEELQREELEDVARSGTPLCGRLSLKECNCPFPAVVKATRLPCRLEHEFIVGVLGVEPQEVRWMTKEAPHCLYEFVLDT